MKVERVILFCLDSTLNTRFHEKKIKSLALFNAINTLSGHSKDISCFVVCVDKVALPLLINLAVL